MRSRAPVSAVSMIDPACLYANRALRRDLLEHAHKTCVHVWHVCRGIWAQQTL